MMKIDALKLVAFGPFTGKVIDFSGNGYGLHIVFGPNENVFIEIHDLLSYSPVR